MKVNRYAGASIHQRFGEFTKWILWSLMLLAFMPASYGQANTGSVTGTVKDGSGNLLENAVVTVKETRKGSVTDSKGTYTITGIAEGKYTLVVQLFGYKPVEAPAEVKAGETTAVPTILLKEKLHELEEVNVLDSRNRFGRERSEYVAKLPLKNLENPQVYNTISVELLASQVTTSFNDALKNAPGLTRLWESTGRGGDGAGYYSLRGFAVQPTIINGVAGLTNGNPDPANMERIEVIKGPSGTLYGSSLISYGGLINIVTKRPYSAFGGEIGYTTGSFGLNRITADFNTPLTADKNVALRINTAYHTENSFQDAGFRKSFFFAPSLSYKVNEKLSFLVNTEFYNGETTNPTMVFLNRYVPLVAKNLDELGYDSKRSYTSNDVTISTPTFSMQAQMQYKLSNTWTSQTILSRSSAKTDGYYTYLWDLADGNGTYGRYASKQNSNTLGTDIQQNFLGDFKLGKMRNRMIAGVDYFNRSIIDNSTGYIGFDNVIINKPDASQLSRAALDTALAGAGISKSRTEEEIYSAYISDVLNITPSLSAMVSLRVDHFNNKGAYDALLDTTTGKFNQTALSPKFGLVYQPIRNHVSVFANYMNGYTNVAPRVQNDGTRKTFSPEQANQWEAGVKTEMFEGKLSATVSYYDILVSNVVREDPNNMNFYIQDGQNYSRGIELSVTASPVRGLNLIAGYSHNDSKVTKTDADDYRDRRPEGAGPQDLVNAWISYRVPVGKLTGLGVGFGGNYASENLILNRATTGVFILPSYTVLNASVSYDTDAFRIALKLDNLTDKTYYSGWSTINPQKPRSILATFSYKF